MYSQEKSRKNEPSFSSTLLDEIYRSIDDNTEDSNFFYRDYNKLVKGQVNFRGNGSYTYSRSHLAEDEEMAGFRRARLVDKWMLTEGNENLSATRHSLVAESEKSFQDKDLLCFSSNSSSSDSSGALSSSSDTEFFSSSRVSCFSSVSRPKPGGKNGQEDQLDDCKMGDENLFKPKSRALKIYASLRKVKQPISPGGKLTSFINSLFNHANEKKFKKDVDSKKGIKVQCIETSSNCSSAPSFSRSCLSKNSREKMRNGSQRTVRFDPVSVIFNEESRPCGSKSMIGEVSKGFVRHPSATNRPEDLKFRTRVETDDVLYGFRKNSYTKVEVEEDDDDAISDSSSDLFELDHLSLFGHNRFCQELPMYETTHYGTNRAIRSGMIT